MAFVIGALSQRGQGWREKILWSGTVVCGLASLGLLFTHWRPHFSLSLDALWPVVTVGIVSLMLEGRRSETKGGRAEPRPFPKDALLSALEALAAPQAAQVELERLKGLQIPPLPAPEAFLNPQMGRDALLNIQNEQQRFARNFEGPDGAAFGDRLAAEEARIRGDALYSTQQPDEPAWPAGDIKQLWHLASARVRLFEEERGSRIAEEEARARLSAGRLNRARQELEANL